MLIFCVALSSCLHLLRKELRSAGVSNTLSFIQLLWRRDHQPSVQVIYTNVFRRTGALFSCFKHLWKHAVVNGITRTSPSAVCKVDTVVRADHVVLLECWIRRS